jgi:phosphoribosylaminoimidazolecarboxamide formyltransferase/IMP cyclohydrolase
MATIEYVREIDDFIKIQTVFATVTDKAGLVGNEKKDGSKIEGLPEEGLLGLLFDINPDALVISTGGTAKLIADAGYNVMEVGEYTGWPEMATGLVKSMNPKLYVGMLAHQHTKSDADYMSKHNVPTIDMALVNFYPFQEAVADHPVKADPETKDDQIAAIELIRQNMDVGGPTAVHTSRKGYLTTAVATRPEDYVRFAEDMKAHDGCIGLESRFIAMQHCSQDLSEYYAAISDFMDSITVDDVRKAYPRINNTK